MSVDQLRKIYPSLPSKTGQTIDRGFKDCLAFEVALSNPQVAGGEDPTLATVTTRSTYICTPKGRQARQPSSIQDVFLLQKVGGEWLINSMSFMDTARRQ